MRKNRTRAAIGGLVLTVAAGCGSLDGEASEPTDAPPTVESIESSLPPETVIVTVTVLVDAPTTTEDTLTETGDELLDSTVAWSLVIAEEPGLASLAQVDGDELAEVMCETFDDLDDFDASMAIVMLTGLDEGFSGAEIGVLSAYAVAIHCPDHWAAMQEWSDS